MEVDLRQMLVGDYQNLTVLHFVWKFALVSWAISMAAVILTTILIKGGLQSDSFTLDCIGGLIWSIPAYIGGMLFLLLFEPLLIFQGRVFHSSEQFPPSLLFPWITGHIALAAIILLIRAMQVSNSSNDKDVGDFIAIAGLTAAPLLGMALLLLGSLYWPSAFTLDTLLVMTLGAQSLFFGVIALIVIIGGLFSFMSWLAS